MRDPRFRGYESDDEMEYAVGHCFICGDTLYEGNKNYAGAGNYLCTRCRAVP